MSALVTEAYVERRVLGIWRGERGPIPIPEAIEVGRALRRTELQHVNASGDVYAFPVRVIDSAGAVVAQWGRP